MTSLMWCSALCGALAGVAMPYASARTVSTLRPQPRSGRTPALAGGMCGRRWWQWSPLACGGGAVVSVGVARLVGDRPGGSLLVAGWLVVLYAGMLLSMVDVRTRRLPTPVIGVAALGLGMTLVGHAFATDQGQTLIRAGLAAGALGGFYLLIAVLGGSAVGLGDVRLTTLLGGALGALDWPAVLYGCLLPYLLAAPEAVIRLALRRQPDLAFGPYLLAGAFLSVALINH
ncbi:peptidase A24 [Micromonospora sp. NPDC092111]|uniref:peptidase A24 n=1 Tax=Micromonospora sp. NPDC092111 TaxID=3364289 RepID=UPI0038031F14